MLYSLKDVKTVIIVHCGVPSNVFFLLLAGFFSVLSPHLPPTVIGSVFQVLTYPVIDMFTSDGFSFPQRFLLWPFSSSVREGGVPPLCKVNSSVYRFVYKRQPFSFAQFVSLYTIVHFLPKFCIIT